MPTGDRLQRKSPPPSRPSPTALLSFLLVLPDLSASSSHLGLDGGDNAYVSYGDALSLSQNSNKFVGSQTKIQSQKASFVSTSAKLNLDADENKVEASFQY